jgi:tetratricopeptide (TPR) repeat protein
MTRLRSVQRGLPLDFVVGDHANGEALIDRAIALNPNLAWAWLFSSWVKVWHGEPEVAIERIQRSMRLSPNDPHSFTMYSAMAAAHFFAGRYTESLSWAEKSLRERPNYLLPMLVAAASKALAGPLAEAERTMALVRRLDPALRISTLKNLYFASQPEHAARWAEGLRLTGLPE